MGVSACVCDVLYTCLFSSVLCPNNGALGGIRLPPALAVSQGREDKESRAGGSGQAGSTGSPELGLLPASSEEGTLSEWLSWLIGKALPWPHPISRGGVGFSQLEPLVPLWCLLPSQSLTLEQLGDRLKRSPLVLVPYACCPQHLEASRLPERSASVLVPLGTGGNRAPELQVKAWGLTRVLVSGS